MARIKTTRRIKIPVRQKTKKNNAYQKTNKNNGRSLTPKSQSIRNVVQCLGNTTKKRQCKKRTARTNQCWIHLGKNRNLRIKESSTGHGFGLYNGVKPIKKYAPIAKYTGRKTTQYRLDRRYGAKNIAQYSLCNGWDHCVDANLSTHGPARYANDARGSNHTNNSTFKVRNGKFYLDAVKRIKPGQEIFADYGADYWPRGFFKKK